MSLDACAVRGIVERVCGRRGVLAACQRRDLGEIIRVLGAHGVTQGKIAELTGIGQGRLSEWAGGRRAPRATSSFEAFADGLGLPPPARQALGLAPVPVPATPVRVAARASSGRSEPPAVMPPPEAAGLPTAAAGRVSPDSLADLRGLEPVQDQLRDVLAILEAERGRELGGWTVKRRAWKNLVFTGGPGGGKSRTAAAVARAYWKLGLLSSGHVLEVAAADLTWTDAGERGALADKMFRNATGGVLVINAADDWYQLPDRGRHVARQLYAQLTEYRTTLDDQVAVILTGQADPLLVWLHGHPQLAARFLAVIEFPRYTPAQLTAVFGRLADEAGLRLTAGARQKSAAVIEQAEREGGAGLVPGGAQVGAVRWRFGADRVVRVVVAGQFAVGADGGGVLLPGFAVGGIVGDRPEGGERPGGAGGCGVFADPAPALFHSCGEVGVEPLSFGIIGLGNLARPGRGGQRGEVAVAAAGQPQRQFGSHPAAT